MQPAPPHRLENLENVYNKFKHHVVNKNEILIIGPYRSLVPTMLEGTDLDPSGDKEFFKLLQKLQPINGEKVVVRFRRQHGYDEAYEKKVISLLPKGSQIDTQERSIVEAYANAKEVIIVDPFTTSALECEYLSIPYQVLGKPSKEFMQIPSYIPEVYE